MNGELFRWIHRRWKGKVRVRRDPVHEFVFQIDRDVPETLAEINAAIVAEGKRIEQVFANPPKPKPPRPKPITMPGPRTG